MQSSAPEFFAIEEGCLDDKATVTPAPLPHKYTTCMGRRAWMISNYLRSGHCPFLSSLQPNITLLSGLTFSTSISASSAVLRGCAFDRLDGGAGLLVCQSPLSKRWLIKKAGCECGFVSGERGTPGGAVIRVRVSRRMEKASWRGRQEQGERRALFRVCSALFFQPERFLQIPDHP